MVPFPAFKKQGGPNAHCRGKENGGIVFEYMCKLNNINTSIIPLQLSI